MFANARRPHSYHHHLHPQQPLSVCRGCGFSTRHAALLDRHRRHCTRSSKLETGSAVQAVGTGATSSAQRRVLLPAPSVCRNYKCSKCSFVTNRAKLFLYHQNCIHGENINVYGCDHCEYASRHKNKVLRHKRLVHKVASISNETPARTLISADNNFPQPVSSSTPQQQQQQQQQLQQLPLTIPSTSDFKSQSSSGALDCPVDLSASEEASVDASAAEEPDNNNIPDGGSGAVISPSRTSALDFIKMPGVETPSNSETVNGVDIGGELSDGGHMYYSMKFAGNATLEVMQTGTTEDLAETATKILSSCAAESVGGETPSVPLLRCRYCRYTNRHKWKMASHVRASHSAGRPVYRCPECPRFSTDSRVEWSAHRSRHTGKVMFECPECAYATTMKRNYERHLERHRAGGPRRCGLCSYSSTGEGAIQRHMAEYHPPSPNRPLPPRIADSPLAQNGGQDDDEMTSDNLLSLTSRPLEISFGDGSVGDNSTSGGPMSFQMGSKQDTQGGRSLIAMETGCSKERATSSSSTLPFDMSDSAPGDTKLSSLNSAANPTRPSKSVLLNLTKEGAITLSTLTSKTAKLPIAALQFCSGGGLSPAAVGRCVCPMCPLSYKRPADLNRHMKQKHETTLKEFVLRNRLSRATSPSAETSMWPSMSSISPVSALTVHGAPSRSGVVSPDGLSSSSSSSSVVEIPLNLSTKDQDVKSLVAATRCGNEVVNLSMNAPEETPTLKSSTSCEQSEPLDLSTLGGSDIKKQSSASTVPDVTILDAAAPLLLVGTPQPPSQRHLEPIVSAHRPARTTIGGVQIFRTTAGYPCGHCTYVSKRASDLRRHQLVHSTSSKRYRCPHCPVDRSYKLQFDLGRHLSRVHGHLTATTGAAGTATTTVSTAAPRRHTGSGKMISLIGRKSAPDDGDGRYTTLSHDSSVWTSSSGTVKNHLACPYCQYVGKSLAELERHARLHSGEKPHRCPFCVFSTIWKSDMKVHLQKLHREESALTGDFEDLLDRICRNVPIAVTMTTTVNNQPKTEVSDVTGSGAVAVDHNMNVATVDGGKTSDDMITAKSGFHFGGRTEDRKFHRQSVPESSVLERPLGRCPLCPFQCQTPSEMSSHLQMHEKKPTKLPAACGKLFVCMRCSVSFSNRSDARNHVVLEHSEIPDPDRAIEEKHDSRINAVVVIGGPSTTSSSVSPRLINQQPKEGVKVVDGEAMSDSDRKSPKPTSSIGTSGTVGDVGNDRVDEVEKLAEQYANVVTEMLYGNESPSTSTSTSVPAINQLCRYAATSMSSTAPGGPASIKGSPAVAESTLISGSKLSTPSSLSTVDVTSKIPSQSTSTTGATGGRFRPYKCSQCGKRSNWRWDLKKHIRSSRHPHADVVVLSDREARESFHEIADQMNLKRSGLASNHHGFTTASSPGNRQYSYGTVSGGSHGPERHSFVCSTCGFRSGSKADLVRHTLLAHPSSETSSTADGDFGTLAPSTASASPSGTGTEASTLVTLPQERALYTVDRQKLKRLHCSACPYRSNFRSDVGRHIRHKHPNSAARIEVMTSSEAAASLADYLDTWARKKFVLSPVKTYRHMDFQAAAGDSSSLTGNGPEDGKPTPVVTMGNFVGCSSVGYAQGVGDEPEMEMEDETLPWKCAACDFTDPGKQAVVEHWQKWHCGGRIHVDGENPSLAAGSTCSELTTTKLDASRGTLGDSSSPSEHSSASHKRTSPNNSDVQPGWGKPLQCDICPYRTNKLGLLTIHKTYHRPQSKNSHKCPHCPYYVCAPRLLHQHVRIHSGYGGSPQLAATTSSTARHQIVDGNTSTEDSVATGDQVLASSSSSAAAAAAAAAAVTGNRTLYPCASCPYVGHNRNDYIYHRQFHRQRPSAPFKCERCPYWVGQRRLLTQHRRVHAQAYRMAHPTELSTKVVSSSANLGEGARNNVESNGVENRVENRVEDASALAIAVVMESGSRTSNLASQKGNTIGKASGSLSTGSGRRVVQRTIWRCDRCPYSTAKRSQLETHRQLHGSGQRYTCERCDYSVSGVHLLLQHVRLHESGNSAAAPTTGDVERSGREDLHLPSPSASTSPPPQQQQQQQHLQHVDGGKEEAQRERESKIAVIGGGVDDGSPSSMSGSRPLYRCDKCPYANARRDHLLCHAKFHSGVGPLVCRYCDYSVSKVHLLTQHARVHTQSATATVSTTSSPVFPPFTTTETKPIAVPLETIADVELTVCRRGEKHDESSAILPQEDLVAKSLFLRTLHLTTAAVKQ